MNIAPENVAADVAASTTPAATGFKPVLVASDGSAPAADAVQRKGPYPPPAPLPTQIGPEDIRYDFNQGCRVLLPARTSGTWRVRLRDLDTGNILYQAENKGALVNSAKRWFLRFSVDVWSIEEGAPDTPRLVLSHELDLTDRNILIQFPVGTLGDTLAWFPYVARFAEVHPEARVTCALSDVLIPLLQEGNRNIRLVTHVQVAEEKLAETAYATYAVGLFFDDVACDWQPTDFRHVGLHKTAAYILGVSPDEERPRLALPDESRPIAEPYVCIAVQSTTGCKTWTNPGGWREVIPVLKEAGYRVICIDQKPVHGTGLMWTHVPHGVEDETGDKPLAERARYLRHADFFVGLSSGLSWLAWASGTKVVMISGFTHPTNEFATPFRIINWHACNSCWNDPKERFDHKDFLWCPRHANTPRQFECTRLITAAQVIQVIKSIDGFGEHRNASVELDNVAQAETKGGRNQRLPKRVAV